MFTLSLKPKIWKIHVVIWQTTSKNCTKVRAARAARLFFLIQPIRSLFSGVVVAVASSLLKLPKCCIATGHYFFTSMRHVSSDSRPISYHVLPCTESITNDTSKRIAIAGSTNLKANEKLHEFLGNLKIDVYHNRQTAKDTTHTIVT